MTHISFSASGGSGTVAKTLVEAQRVAGRTAHHATVIEKNLRVQPLTSPQQTLAAGIDEYLIKNANFAAPISVARDRLGGVPHRVLEGSEVLHLHGYNGAIRLDRFAEAFSKKRIVWTLHDMNPFTGACHYSLGCSGFVTDCSSCPAVRKPFQSTVSTNLTRKIDAIAQLENLHVVVPSAWLGDEATRSTAFAGKRISVIPNPFTSTFLALASPPKSAPVTEIAGLRLCVVAQNLSDPVKNVREAVAAFRALHLSHPTSQLTLVGAGGTEFAGPGIVRTGPLSSPQLAEILAQSDALVVPSLAENSPLVIAEAAAMGCPSIVRQVGGMPALVKQLGTGDVWANSAELDTILEVYATQPLRVNPTSRKKLSATALALFSPASVIAQYDEHYDEL